MWEEGEETAIQSPAGGTKIAWSGDRFDPDLDRDRQYFVLSAPSDQLDDDVRRLLDLGASAPTPGESGETILRDPDNNRFVVRPN